MYRMYNDVLPNQLLRNRIPQWKKYDFKIGLHALSKYNTLTVCRPEVTTLNVFF